MEKTMIQWFWLFLLFVGVTNGQIQFCQSNSFCLLYTVRRTEVCSTATFYCSHDGIASVNWVIHNGSLVQLLNSSSVGSIWRFEIQTYNNILGGELTTLQLFDLPQSHLSVTCEDVNEIGAEGSPRLLQVQGINLTVTLQEAGDSVILLNWTSTSSSRQVTYCVEVWNNSMTWEMLDSVCGILTEFYSYNRSWCNNYTFRVLLMKSNCTGASSMVNYTDSLASSPPTIQSIPVSLSDRRVLTMSAPVCSCGLRFVDVDTEEIITEDTDVTITETNITFSSRPLSKNRHYNVIVMATNAGGDSTSTSTLSTHNIVDVTAMAKIPNGLILQTSYIDSSESGGVLLALLHTTGGLVDFSKSTYLALSVNSSLNYTLSRTTLSGKFKLLAYGINPEGDLGNDTVFPAVDMATNISTSGQAIAFQNSTHCNISAKSYEIAVSCQDLVNYQVLVQSINLSEIRGLKPGKSTDHQTPVRVQVGETGMYHVAVFPTTSKSGIVGSEMVYSSDVIIVNSGASLSRTTHVGVVATVLAILVSYHQ